MEIQWLGNSSFFIKTANGKRLLLDPFNALKQYNNNISANIITLSKNISGNVVDPLIKTEVKVIYDNNTYCDEDIKIKGYSSFSDSINGLKRGRNYIYTYEIDKVKLCHLGYLGEIINTEMLNTLKFMDFLFIPIGGKMCLDGHEATQLCKLLLPKYVIPMCYNANGNDFYFDGPKLFLSSSKNIFKVNSSILDTSTLPTTNKYLTLLLK